MFFAVTDYLRNVPEPVQIAEDNIFASEDMDALHTPRRLVTRSDRSAPDGIVDALGNWRRLIFCRFTQSARCWDQKCWSLTPSDLDPSSLRPPPPPPSPPFSS